jgi:hypothetical protein
LVDGDGVGRLGRRTTSFVVKLGDDFRSTGTARVGQVWGGLVCRNSDVGAASLWASLFLWRLVCRNGLTLPEPRSILIDRRHLGLDPNSVRATLKKRLVDLPARLERGMRALEATTDLPVDDLQAGIRSVLKMARLPLRLVPAVLVAYQHEPSSTVFGLVQALTRAAQALTPEERLQAEVGASRYIQQALAGQAGHVR